MKKALFLTFSLLILLMGTGITYAQDPAVGSKADNACNEGGSMAGKCDSPWAWVCGYYLARWEAAGGWSTAGNTMNTFCLSVLPPRPITADAAAAASGSCIDIGGLHWMSLTTNYIPIGFHSGFTDSDCTMPDPVPNSHNFGFAAAVTTNPADALTICTANGHLGILGPQSQIYFCSNP